MSRSRSRADSHSVSAERNRQIRDYTKSFGKERFEIPLDNLTMDKSPIGRGRLVLLQSALDYITVAMVCMPQEDLAKFSKHFTR